jgi:zinc transport system substrate-binding protein
VRLSATTLGPLLAMVLVGCGNDDPSVVAEQAGKPVVVTALRPLAEAIERVAGDEVVVVNLTPVDESPHELEIVGRVRDEVLDADLVVVLGRGFQPDLERLAEQRDAGTLDVLEALELPDRPDGGAGPVEPHVWLDPTFMGTIVSTLADAVADVVPDAAGKIRERAERAVEDLVTLDAQIRQQLTACRRTVIASQHEAFGWLAARYGLTNVGFDAPIPDDDPAPDQQRLLEIRPALEDGSVTTLFTETLAPPSWIEEIADEHGLDTAVLNPYEGLTPEEQADDATYRTILLYDARVLSEHLDCEGAA